MPNRILIIGLDGGTWNVFSPLIERGIMPNLTNSIGRGTNGVLLSTFPPTTPVAWTSFQTGVNPSKHLIYDFLQYQRGTYKAHIVNSLSIKVRTIWEVLSGSNLKVALVGVPLTYPPRAVNGVVISGFLTPSIHTRFTYPADLRYELADKVGDYRFFTPPTLFFRKGLRKFLEEGIYTLRKRTETAIYILNKYKWNVAMVHFQSLDNLQHVLLPLLDTSNQLYSPDKYRMVIKFYKSLDDAIGKILKIIDRDTNSMIISDHGFCKVKKFVYLNRWLELRGYLKVRRSIRDQIFSKVMDAMRLLDIFSFRYLLSGVNIQEKMMKSLTNMGIDWPKTSAYMFSGAHSGNIYVNLKGREPQGIISRADYDKIRYKLKEELLNLRDSDSGGPVVNKVYFREEITPVHTEAVPDLLIEPQEGYCFSQVLHYRQVLRVPRFGREHVGCHKREGMYILFGPDFEADDRGRLRHITDITATILSYFNIEIPSYFDGSPVGLSSNSKIGNELLE